MMSLISWVHGKKFSLPRDSFLTVLLVSLGLWAALIFGCYRYLVTPEHCKDMVQFPYEISSPGCYQLTKDVSLSKEIGVAIVVKSNLVRIELNGFRIEGGGQSFHNTGISIRGGHDISVQNGTLNSFLFGIRAEPDGEAGPARRLLIKNITLNDHALRAVIAGGSEIHLENILVKNTGVRVVFPNAQTAGIELSGKNCSVSNTHVVDTIAFGTGEAAALILSGDVAGCRLASNTFQNNGLRNCRTTGILSKDVSGEVYLIDNQIRGFSIVARQQ